MPAQYLLLESGSSLLLESGSALLLESSDSGADFFELCLLEYLLGSLDITVYPGHIPQGVDLPALSFFILGEDHLNKIGGAAGLCVVRVQFTISSTDYLEVGRLQKRLRDGLHGFKGLMGTIRVDSAFPGNALGQYEPAVDASDRGAHAKISDWTFIYRESIPTPNS